MSKGCVFEGALGIPLIIRPPGGTEPWVASGLTDHYDIVDTLLDAANGAPLETDHGSSLIQKIEAGQEAHDAQQGKEVVFSEVNLYSMAHTGRYKMTINSLTREPLELYDMENDPNELRNLVNEPRLANMRSQFLNEHYNQLLANVNEAQLKVFEAGGIPTAIHQDYPAY